MRIKINEEDTSPSIPSIKFVKFIKAVPLIIIRKYRIKFKLMFEKKILSNIF